MKGSSEPTADLGRDGVAEIGVTLRHLLADVFALHMKTKNFHWHGAAFISVTTICSSTSTLNRSSR